MGCRFMRSSREIREKDAKKNYKITFAILRVFFGHVLLNRKTGENRKETRPPYSFQIAYDGLTTTNAMSRAKSTSDSISASAMIISV